MSRKQKAEKIATPIKPWGQSNHIPPDVIKVTSYKGFVELIEKWTSGKLDDTLIVVGSAGIGKSETALKAIAATPHLYIKGRSTKYGLYLSLYQSIDLPVILDDVDTLFADKEVTGLLKMLLETRNPKILNWVTGATMKDDSSVPPQFTTNSRTLILANELKVVSKNFAAVLDRATVIWFAPDADEIHRYVGTWFKDKEVYQFCGRLLGSTPSPSARFYVKALKLKQADLDWKAMIQEQMQPRDESATFVAQLLNDKSHKSEASKVTAFKVATGKTEQTYYAIKRAILLNQGGKVSARSRAVSKAMRLRHSRRK